MAFSVWIWFTFLMAIFKFKGEQEPQCAGDKIVDQKFLNLHESLSSGSFS